LELSAFAAIEVQYAAFCTGRVQDVVFCILTPLFFGRRVGLS
jgi:hypothetical protein